MYPDLFPGEAPARKIDRHHAVVDVLRERQFLLDASVSVADQDLAPRARLVREAARLILRIEEHDRTLASAEALGHLAGLPA